MPSSRPRRSASARCRPPRFEPRNEWLESFIAKLEPPPFPGRIDAELARQRRTDFRRELRRMSCRERRPHRHRDPARRDRHRPEHVLAWRQHNADRMNTVVRLLGADNADIQGAQDGYVAKPLVGVWLLGPYLHNGSVPTLRDLLSPPEQRPRVFYRGYDVVDLENIGFISTGPEAAARGFRIDTAQRGNGNAGHRVRHRSERTGQARLARISENALGVHSLSCCRGSCPPAASFRAACGSGSGPGTEPGSDKHNPWLSAAERLAESTANLQPATH